jgi:hypothetical protein
LVLPDELVDVERGYLIADDDTVGYGAGDKRGEEEEAEEVDEEEE